MSVCECMYICVCISHFLVELADDCQDSSPALNAKRRKLPDSAVKLSVFCIFC